MSHVIKSIGLTSFYLGKRPAQYIYQTLDDFWVVEFHDPTLGIGKVYGQESTVVKWNYQILSLHLVTACQKVPILDFQSEFSMSKIIRIFLKKNSLKNINLGAPFL